MRQLYAHRQDNSCNQINPHRGKLAKLSLAHLPMHYTQAEILISLIPRPRLPKVPIYILTKEIPEVAGGVTTVALGKCNSFINLTKQPVSLLTLSPEHALTAEIVHDELVLDGRLDSRVQFGNAWADLLKMSEDEIANLPEMVSGPIQVETARFDGEPEALVLDDEGRQSRTDRFRADGSIGISDWRAPNTLEPGPKRLITLFSRDGTIARQWTSATQMYGDWLKALTKHSPMSILISERLASSDLLVNWSSDNVTFIQSVHSNHFNNADMERYQYPPPRAKFYQTLDSRDLVTTLTTQQSNDLRLANLTAAGNVATLPNWLPHSPLRRPTPRRRGDGIIVSRMSEDKRLDHSIRAIQGVTETLAPQATLDLFGDGGCMESLVELTEELDVSQRVKFHGYLTNGGKKFRDYSFTLLSSRSEGQGLVLLEAMAAGCVPIAYNVKYGPGEIINHGVNGFLVEPGDVSGLSHQIEQFMKMPEYQVRSLRSAAIRRSRDFMPEKIERLWTRELQRAIERKSNRETSVRGTARLRSLKSPENEFELTIRLSKALSDVSWKWCKICWLQPGTKIYGRLPAKFSHKNGKLLVRATIPLERLLPAIDRPERRIDFYLDVGGDSVQMMRLRIKADSQTIDQRDVDLEFYSTQHGNLSAKLFERNALQLDEY